jgi:hypothetical protein
MSKYGVEFLKNPSKLYVPSDTNKDAPDFQLRENGYLFVSSTKEGLQLLKENNRTQKDVGVTWTHMMDQAAMAAKFPWLKVSDLTGGTYGSENEGYFDPWSLLAALKAKVCHLSGTYVSTSFQVLILHHAGNLPGRDLRRGRGQRRCDVSAERCSAVVHSD